MKRQLLLLAGLAVLFQAVSVSSAEKPYYVKDGKKTSVNEIKVDPSGTLEFKDATGKFTQKLKANEYDYAFDSDPAGVKQAYSVYKSGDYKKAAEEFAKAYSSYRFLGWGAYCKQYEGECLDKAGDRAKAISVLDSWQRKFKTNKAEEKYYIGALKLLADLQIESGKYTDAEEILQKLESTTNDEAAASACNARGKMMVKQNKLKDAVCEYLQTVLLFQQSNDERPEALCNVANLLKQLNDARSVKFAEMLKNEYPDNDFVNQLK